MQTLTVCMRIYMLMSLINRLSFHFPFITFTFSILQLRGSRFLSAGLTFARRNSGFRIFHGNAKILYLLYPGRSVIATIIFRATATEISRLLSA
jgi:hypothetical protein